MFSRCNIIQNRWFKKVTPFTIEKRIEVKIFAIPAHFSISQPSKPNPSTFLVKTFSDTRSPRSSANRPNSSKLPPSRFHSFYSFGSGHRQLTIARVARTRLLIDPRPFVTAPAREWTPFTSRAGKNLPPSLSPACLLFYATRNSIYSALLCLQWAGRRRGKPCSCHGEIFQALTDRLRRASSYRSSLWEMMNKIW